MPAADGEKDGTGGRSVAIGSVSMRQSEALRALLLGADDRAAGHAQGFGIDVFAPVDIACAAPAASLKVSGADSVEVDGVTALIGRFLRADLHQAAAKNGVAAVAVTAPGGPETIVASFRLARAAALASARVVSAGLTPWVDALYFAALGGDDEARGAFVGAMLDPIAERRPLMLTLSTASRCGWHIDTTAAVLGIHRNTVHYRIDLARKLAGFSLPRDRERLSVALTMQALSRAARSGQQRHSAATKPLTYSRSGRQPVRLP